MSNTLSPPRQAFVSYSSQDRRRVQVLADRLRAAGINIWRDGDQILGGENYGPRVVQGIRESTVLLLACSDASLRSKNVKQEIQLAWKYNVPYLPILLEPLSFPEQVEYWLEGAQWIEVLDRPEADWLPRILQSIDQLSGEPSLASTVLVAPTEASRWERLWKLARYTDQLWPVPANAAEQGPHRGTTRGLGAAQPAAQHGYRLGQKLRLVLECDTSGHLLLLDQGPEGIVYCLCPSAFARETHVSTGRTVFPLPGSPYDSFVLTGKPGREQLLAIVTVERLPLDWMPRDTAREPARVLQAADIDHLLNLLQDLPGDAWTAKSSYFEVLG